MSKNITSKRDGVTRDIVPNEEVEQEYTITSLGVTVVAKSMSEALVKAKEVYKERKQEDNQ